MAVPVFYERFVAIRLQKFRDELRTIGGCIWLLCYSVLADCFVGISTGGRKPGTEWEAKTTSSPQLHQKKMYTSFAIRVWMDTSLDTHLSQLVVKL